MKNRVETGKYKLDTLIKRFNLVKLYDIFTISVSSLNNILF